MIPLGERRNHGVAPPNRCPMGPDSSASALCPTSSEGRTTGRRRPALLRRDSLDSVDWGPLERAPQAVWQSQYLLAAAATVGSQRGAARVVAGLAGPA